MVNKDAFFDLIEHKAVSLVIGVIDRSQETSFASRAGDQKWANGVLMAEFGNQPELPACESFLVMAFGATEEDRGMFFKEVENGLAHQFAVFEKEFPPVTVINEDIPDFDLTADEFHKGSIVILNFDER